MDPRLRQTHDLLVEWARRDREDYHRTDDRREGVRRRQTRCLLLLLPRLPRPEEPPVDLPNPSSPALQETPRVSIRLRQADPVESGYHPRVPV